MIAAQLNQTITIGDLYPDETVIKRQRVIGYKDSYIFSDDGVTWNVMGDRKIVDTSRAYQFDPAWYDLLVRETDKPRIFGLLNGEDITERLGKRPIFNRNPIDAKIDYQESVLKACLLSSDDIAAFKTTFYRDENKALYLDCLSSAIDAVKFGIRLNDILKLSSYELISINPDLLMGLR